MSSLSSLSGPQFPLCLLNQSTHSFSAEYQTCNSIKGTVNPRLWEHPAGPLCDPGVAGKLRRPGTAPRRGRQRAEPRGGGAVTLTVPRGTLSASLRQEEVSGERSSQPTLASPRAVLKRGGQFKGQERDQLGPARTTPGAGSPCPQV